MLNYIALFYIILQHRNATGMCAQASVYLARSGKGNARRVKARSVHAPARRLARTTISLGPDEGIAFGLRAVRYSPVPHSGPVHDHLRRRQVLCCASWLCRSAVVASVSLIAKPC